MLLVAVCGMAFLAACAGRANRLYAVPPQAKAAIDRGVEYLRGRLKSTKDAEMSDGRSVIAAYAMIKGGAPPDDPQVQRVIAAVRQKAAGGRYRPANHIIYTAGCELMLLEAAQRKEDEYRSEMQTIVNFIAASQSPQGFWNYLGGDRVGDTSVTQYGILGLWAAERAGIDVPPAAWDRAAQWLIAHQGSKGGFRYRPSSNVDAGGATLSMTIAGVSTLAVARRYLYPGGKPLNEVSTGTKKATDNPLEKVDLDRDPTKKPKKKRRKRKRINYKPNVSYAQLNQAIENGLGWLDQRYSGSPDPSWPAYSLYGMERMAALVQRRTVAKRDWYADGMKYFLRRERNGRWPNPGLTGDVAATSFAILFLSQSTAKLLGQPVEYIGDGLLRGGKGLPDDLSTIAEGEQGQLKRKKVSGPLDDLLSELQKPRALDVPAVQDAIVEKIQLGDRKEWLKPERRKQLLRMANHRDPAVRSVAVWALGRTGGIEVAHILIDALEHDPDLDVAINAREGLCWLSRKPNGFGLPEKPEIPPGADRNTRLQAIASWRRQAVQKWKRWYFTVRPYEERDDLREVKPRR